MKKKNNLSISSLVIILALGALVAGCGTSASATDSTGTGGLGSVSMVTVSDSIETTGNLDADQLAKLTWKTSGIVDEVNVQAGQQVKAQGGKIITCRIAASQLTACISEYRLPWIFPNIDYLLRYNILKVVHVAASSNESSSVAFILLTHILSGSIYNEYQKIQTSSEGLGVPWFLFQGAADQLSRVRKIKNVYTVSRTDLLAMDYPTLNPEVVPGSVHFPLLRFYNHHPEYRHYWLIEYDVRFSGNWRVLFSDFSGFEADFIAAHVRNYSEEPDWERWNISHPTQSIPLEDRLRCFHPIFRVSNLALSFISSVYRQEWRGHSEVLLPTLLQQNGFSIRDFGGNGSFVPPGMKNKYYTDALPNRKGVLDTGSMRYRPSYARPGPERNKLYHPIKPRAIRWKMQIRSFLYLLFGKQRAGKIVSTLKSLPEKTHSSEDHS